MKKAIAIILSIMLVLVITLPAAAISTIAVKSIKLDNSKITLKVGQTSNLNVTFTPANTSQKNLVYVTDNKNVATVDSAGKITGVHAGTTTITVLTLDKKIFAKCNVTISQLSKLTTEVKVWHRSGTLACGPVYEGTQFNKKQKEVKATVEIFGDNYGNMLKLALAGNTAPDIFELNPSAGTPTINQAAEAGYISDIEDIFQKVKPKLDPGVLSVADFFYQGKIYVIPTTKTFYQLFMNNDLLKKAGLDPQNPPKTLEQVRDYAKKITTAGKGEFYGFGLPLGVANVWFRTIDQMVVPTGMGTYGFNYETGKFDFSNEKKYFDLLLGIQKDGSILPGYVSQGIESMRAKFAEGKVGMYFDGNWILGQYNVTQKCDFEIGVANVPILEGQKFDKGYAAYGNGGFAINSRTKNIDAAKKFLLYMVETDGEVKLANFAQGPSTIKLDKQVVPKANKEQFKIILANEPKYTPFKYEPSAYIALNGDNRDKVFTVEFVKAIDGKGNIDAAIADLTKRYNEALDTAISSGKILKENIKK